MAGIVPALEGGNYLTIFFPSFKLPYHENRRACLYEILFLPLPVAMRTTFSPLGRFLLFFLLSRCVNLNAVAQNSAAPPSISHIVISDATAVLEDGLSFWSAPVRFSGQDWIIAGGTVAGTIGAISADNYLSRRFSIETDDQLPHTLWEIPTYYGELEYAGIFSAGVYGVGLVSSNTDVRITGRLVFESLALSGSAVLALRYITGRAGPGPNGDSRDFKGFQWNAERQAFPSGHSVFAFALSTVLAERIGNPLACIGLYGMASLTAYSRVRFTQHWTSDVLAGSALGIATGFFVVSREREREGESGKHEGLSIMPTANGLCVQYTFR
jgi:membrane-associated phospholipid phosphatase